MHAGGHKTWNAPEDPAIKIVSSCSSTLSLRDKSNRKTVQLISSLWPADRGQQEIEKAANVERNQTPDKFLRFVKRVCQNEM